MQIQERAPHRRRTCESSTDRLPAGSIDEGHVKNEARSLRTQEVKPNIWLKAYWCYQRWVSRKMYRRPAFLRTSVPVISFTFDDFPSSALRIGGAILKEHETRGTYYASLGLMSREAPVGTIFSRNDLSDLIADGHELGCHTYAHSHAWNTPPQQFEQSIAENERVLRQLLPNASFKTMSYPISEPRPRNKRLAARRFTCCRGGGQTFNVGVMDRNYLRAFFLEKSQENPKAVSDIIESNARARGWLILATHDVCDHPTRFGCTPRFFEDVVKCASASGARILPIGEAWDFIQGHRESRVSREPLAHSTRQV